MVDGEIHGAHGPKSHAGDLGNIKANASGVARFKMKVKRLTLSDYKYSIRNRSLIIHDKADDFKTQPTGASGDRIACGEIR
jgi:Cu-Zn family superoxide dismutase